MKPIQTARGFINMSYIQSFTYLYGHTNAQLKGDKNH